MNDLISIVIPAYNIGDYLPACLDSVLAQTHKNIEVLVINDGSKDHTEGVITEFAQKDSRIKAIHKENGGVTSARLCGMNAATGEWIGFVDGDDFIEPDMFELLLKNALKHKADISHCGYRMVFPNGHTDYYYNTKRIEIQNNDEGLCALLDGAYVEPGLWNKLFHRSLCESFLNDDKMPRDIKINEDLLMNYFLFKKAQTSVYEDICPYHYLLRKGSAATSKLNNSKLKDPLRVLDMLCEDITLSPQANVIAKQKRLRHMINIATMNNHNQKMLVAPYRREVRKRLRAEWKKDWRSLQYPKTLKLMATWAVICPWSYGLIHKLYSHISGNAHKYDVD